MATSVEVFASKEIIMFHRLLQLQRRKILLINLKRFYRFACLDGFYLDGSSTSVCEDDFNGDSEGVWSSLAPICAPIVCLPPQSNPENGFVGCSNANNLGSECRWVDLNLLSLLTALSNNAEF